MPTKKAKSHFSFMILLSVLDATESEVLEMIDRTLTPRFKNRDSVFHGVYTREGIVYAEWTLQNDGPKPYVRTQEFFTQLANMMLQFERTFQGFATLQVNTRMM